MPLKREVYFQVCNYLWPWINMILDHECDDHTRPLFQSYSPRWVWLTNPPESGREWTRLPALNMDEGLWFCEKWKHIKWLNDWLRVFSQTSSTVFPRKQRVHLKVCTHATCSWLLNNVQTSKSIWNTVKFNNEINYTGQNQNFIGLELLSSRQLQKSFRWLAQYVLW